MSLIDRGGSVRIRLYKIILIKNSGIKSWLLKTKDNKDRNEYESKQTLKKAILQALEDTNWKLMSEGLSYRLGILSGRFRAVDRREEMLSTQYGSDLKL